MFCDRDFKDKLIVTDIMVWNGVVTRFGCVQHFINDGDMIRMADDEEVDHYRSTRGWYNMKAGRRKILDKIDEFLTEKGIRPSTFQIVRAHESVAIKYIPKEWVSDYHIDSFVVEFYDATGRRVAINWLGTEFFELPIHEILPIQTLIDLK